MGNKDPALVSAFKYSGILEKDVTVLSSNKNINLVAYGSGHSL